MTDPFVHADAAYVLGALDADERTVFEDHLLTCDDCALRVRELQPVRRRLAGVPESAFRDELIDEQPPDTLLPGLLRQVRRDNRRRHWVTGGLAAVAAACVLSLVIAVWPSSSPAAPKQQAMSAVVASPVSATVALQAKKWGTEVELWCHYTTPISLPAGYEYSLVAVDRAGNKESLGSWTMDPGRAIMWTTGTGLTPAEISSLEVELPNGTPILQLSV